MGERQQQTVAQRGVCKEEKFGNGEAELFPCIHSLARGLESTAQSAVCMPKPCSPSGFVVGWIALFTHTGTQQAICDLLTVRGALPNEIADAEASDGHHMWIEEVPDGIAHFYCNGHDSRFPHCRAICQRAWKSRVNRYQWATVTFRHQKRH